MKAARAYRALLQGDGRSSLRPFICLVVFGGHGYFGVVIVTRRSETVLIQMLKKGLFKAVLDNAVCVDAGND